MTIHSLSLVAEIFHTSCLWINLVGDLEGCAPHFPPLFFLPHSEQQTIYLLAMLVNCYIALGGVGPQITMSDMVDADDVVTPGEFPFLLPWGNAEL